MSRVAEQAQGEVFFQEAIDPAYLLNMTFDNDTDISYGRYQEGFTPMNNADLTNALFANASTGFTPSPYTPNETSVFNAAGYQSQQSYFGSFDGQQNGYFPPQTVIPPQVMTSMPMMNSSDDSQNDHTQPMDSQLTNVDNCDTQETHRESRSKQVKRTSPPEVNTAPPVRKRRARNKKQLSENETRAKRERFLERNRIAASKCRDKKKDWTNKMEEKMRTLQADRKILRELVLTLMDEKRNLTALLHDHSGCNHQGLDAWLKEKATAILSSPDVFTPAVSRTNSFQSRSSSPTESRNHSSVNGYEGSRRNSMDFQQANDISHAPQTKMLSFSPNSQDKVMRKRSSGESMDSPPPHASHDMYHPNSGNSIPSGDGSEQHGSYRDSGISDMESLETSSVDSASLFGVPDPIYASYATSENVLMGNQRLIGHADYGKCSNRCRNPPQLAQA